MPSSALHAPPRRQWAKSRRSHKPKGPASWVQGCMWPRTAPDMYVHVNTCQVIQAWLLQAFCQGLNECARNQTRPIEKTSPPVSQPPSSAVNRHVRRMRFHGQRQVVKSIARLVKLVVLQSVHGHMQLASSDGPWYFAILFNAVPNFFCLCASASVYGSYGVVSLYITMCCTTLQCNTPDKTVRTAYVYVRMCVSLYLCQVKLTA